MKRGANAFCKIRNFTLKYSCWLTKKTKIKLLNGILFSFDSQNKYDFYPQMKCKFQILFSLFLSTYALMEEKKKEFY